MTHITPNFNIEPVTPEDCTAFAIEWEDWNATVEASFEPEEPEESPAPERDICDLVREWEEAQDYGFEMPWDD
jgi:hypothetical protein